MTGFTPLGEALQKKVTQNTPLSKQVEASMVILYAEETIKEIFGTSNAIQAKPLFLKNRTLTITCASSSIAQEIRLKQQQIVDNINKKIGKNEVDRIRYLA
jgi:predicted nucleic acid-binding Zn ribbon protein